MSESFGAYIGKVLEPVMKPCGLGYWQVIVSLISGIAAKEIVVSSMSVLYGVGNVLSEGGMSQLFEILTYQGFGSLNAYSMMLFCLLYVPCAATIGTVYRETNSLRKTVISVVINIATAWIVSALFYQIANLFV